MTSGLGATLGTCQFNTGASNTLIADIKSMTGGTYSTIINTHESPPVTLWHKALANNPCSVIDLRIKIIKLQ